MFCHGRFGLGIRHPDEAVHPGGRSEQVSVVHDAYASQFVRDGENKRYRRIVVVGLVEALPCVIHIAVAVILPDEVRIERHPLQRIRGLLRDGIVVHQVVLASEQIAQPVLLRESSDAVNPGTLHEVRGCLFVIVTSLRGDDHIPSPGVRLVLIGETRDRIEVDDTIFVVLLSVDSNKIAKRRPLFKIRVLCRRSSDVPADGKPLVRHLPELQHQIRECRGPISITDYRDVPVVLRLGDPVEDWMQI